MSLEPAPEPTGDSQPSAGSPAQKEQRDFNQVHLPAIGGQESEQTADGRPECGQKTDAVEQREKPDEQPVHSPVSKGAKLSGQTARLILLPPADRPVSKPVNAGNSTQGQSSSGEQGTGEQDALWLKAILPSALSGWWDVLDKGGSKGLGIKFRWRSPGLQSLTFPPVSGEQFQSLRQVSEEEARRWLGEQTALHLERLLLDPEKCGKALLVAKKLGIDLAESRPALRP